MRLTVGHKLNSLLLFILLIGIWGALGLATRFYTRDLENLLQRKTLDTSALLAGRMQAEMRLLAEKAQFVGETSLADFRYHEDRVALLKRVIDLDPRMMAAGLVNPAPGGSTLLWRFLGKTAREKKLNNLQFAQLDVRAPFHLDRVQKGESDFRFAHDPTLGPILRLALPLLKSSEGRVDRAMIIDMELPQLAALFSSAVDSTSFLVDRDGTILFSSDFVRMPPGSSIAALPIHASLRNTSAPNGQLTYADVSGKIQIGAFHRVGFGELAVLSQIPLEQAHLAQAILYRRGVWLAGAFLFVTLGLGLLFSASLTSRIQRLAEASHKISQGDFGVRIELRKGKDHGDELNYLSHRFNDMAKGLQERAKMQHILEKFHNPDVLNKLMGGRLQLGGERYEGTVLFVDMRGFTTLCETTAPETVIKTLNLFLSRMVDIILKHNGVIDKYIGDSIMAIWGVPEPNSSAVEDALNACLDMRRALIGLDRFLEENKLPSVKIGMGLNQGPLVAGIIGSQERMEFTVIGDSVNTASRVQARTKEFKTDLLVTESVVRRAAERFIFEKKENSQLRGKKETVSLYQVLGYRDPRTGKEHIIRTPYSSWE